VEVEGVGGLVLGEDVDGAEGLLGGDPFGALPGALVEVGENGERGNFNEEEEVEVEADESGVGLGVAYEEAGEDDEEGGEDGHEEAVLLVGNEAHDEEVEGGEDDEVGGLLLELLFADVEAEGEEEGEEGDVEDLGEDEEQVVEGRVDPEVGGEVLQQVGLEEVPPGELPGAGGVEGGVEEDGGEEEGEACEEEGLGEGAEVAALGALESEEGQPAEGRGVADDEGEAEQEREPDGVLVEAVGREVQEGVQGADLQDRLEPVRQTPDQHHRVREIGQLKQHRHARRLLAYVLRRHLKQQPVRHVHQQPHLHVRQAPHHHREVHSQRPKQLERQPEEQRQHRVPQPVLWRPLPRKSNLSLWERERVRRHQRLPVLVLVNTVAT